MKTLISIIFILGFITVCCKDASDKTEFTDNSQIYIEHYDMQVVDNLAILCKVWGFMKYYHPTVLENDHWDFELFRIMPLVINAKSKDERNQILFSMN